MYTIKTLQEFEDCLNERCLKEGESFTLPCIKAWNERRRQLGYSGFSDDEDKVILSAAGGRWFERDIRAELHVYGSNPVSGHYVTQIRPEDKPALLRTFVYIQENFDRIYENLLTALLPALIEWEMENRETRQPVTTIRQLHEARDMLVHGGLETACFQRLQLNCQHQREGMVFYSLGFMPDCTKYGFDDGFEVVLWKDHVVSFSDGNTMDHILYFDKQQDEVSFYFGPPPEDRENG